jgi:hypothetical protein
MTQFKGRGLIQITGRNVGKSAVAAYMRLWNEIMNADRKILWERMTDRKGLWLRAYPSSRADDKVWGLNEWEMNPVHEWSKEHNCGKRMSFDMYKFKNEAEMTMFLLRWAV